MFLSTTPKFTGWSGETFGWGKHLFKNNTYDFKYLLSILCYNDYRCICYVIFHSFISY